MKRGVLVATDTEQQNQVVCWLTYVSQVDEAVLADVRAGAGLRRDDGIAVLFIADDAKLRRLHAAREVHVEDRAQFLQ